jgi:parvulin-like peptidyl-prolyl isomerase
LISLIFLTSIAFAQDDSQPLAKVGNQIITVDEFRNRYEFMPHLNYSSDNKDTLKKEFLYSLIAEKLWALEALERGLDALEFVKNSLKTLEKLFVKDELFRNEVESKIILTPEEIAKGLSRIGKTLSVKIISSSDSNDIYGIKNYLNEADNFDSIFISRTTNVELKKDFQIKLGTLADEFAEDVIFNLRMNEISEPIKSNNTWFIFKLVEEVIDSSIINDNEIARSKTISILSEKKRKALAGMFLDKLLGGRTISANSELFNYFADNLINTILRRIEQSNPEITNNIELKPDDLQILLNVSDKQKLSSLFTEFDSTKLSLTDFIYYLMYQKISFLSSKPNRIKAVLNRAVKQFIEDEVIVQEGYKRGLNKINSVIKDLEMWKNYYLSELMLQTFNDSITISDSEIQNYFSGNKSKNISQIQLNIIEIFTKQLDDMMILLDELNQGKGFSELAKKYNQREYTKKSNGEWGYFLANSAGQIGKIASQLEIGQIYGPVKVEGGYSIIKLLDKIIISDSLIQSNEEPLEYIKMKLSLNKINDLINKNTVKLAGKYKLTINENLLNDIELSEVNMFTYRLIGFGGRIAAMPITIPIFEWYKYLTEQTEIP